MENDAKSEEDESQKEDKKKEEEKKKKCMDVYPYGNFKNYYAHRYGELDEDPRLEVLRKEWFEGKNCLDIGCNSGILTIHVAQKFCCKSILGIDIDSDRIEDAYLNLSKAVGSKSAENKTLAEGSELKDKDHADNLEEGVAASSSEEIHWKERNLYDIVSFKQDNFVQSQYPLEEHYDTILCLSVTQWIHLNWGDKGLITLFYKIWSLLRPGGVLVLEPQQWKSYKKKHQVSKTTTKNFQNIKFRPKKFPKILLDKIGFRTVEHINSAWRKGEIRFNRPILVFKK